MYNSVIEQNDLPFLQLLVDEIGVQANKGKLTGALFLDLSKAFNTINHDLILKKMNSYGICGKELSWFTPATCFVDLKQ